MIEKFTIENFKKFKKIYLENLSRINIFVGFNNVGKTTILEAIMGFASGWNLSSILNLSVWRRFYLAQGNSYQLAELMLNAFNNISENDNLSFTFQGLVNTTLKKFSHSLIPGQIIASCIPGNNIVVDGTEIVHRQVPVSIPVVAPNTIMVDTPSQYLGKWIIQSEEGIEKTYELSAPVSFNQFPNEKSFITAMFHDIFSHRNESEARKIYSFLINFGVLEEFIEELNKSFSGLKIKSINNIPYSDGTEAPISVQFEDNSRRPLYTLGDGLRRWYALLGGMITLKNSIHCIEEADVTFHYKAQDLFAVNLKYYTEKFNNQIFMTTHNIEYLNIFLNAIEKSDSNFLKENLRVITLRDYDDNVKYRILDGLEALRAIQNELELRI